MFLETSIIFCLTLYFVMRVLSVPFHHTQELSTSNAKHVDATSPGYYENDFPHEVGLLYATNSGFAFCVYSIFPLSMC